jgi:DNA adenine methylase
MCIMRQTDSMSGPTPNVTLQPFLKWAGGKRWLVTHFPDLFPKHYRSYLEPFLGGGAVFFALNPQRAILSDCNAELIETYMAIRDDCDAVSAELDRYQLRHSE